MKFIIITLFPEMFPGVLDASILGRAKESGVIDYEIVNLRDFGIGPRKQVDDTPYGGGAGMVLRVDVMAKALENAKLKTHSEKHKTILLTPQGERLVQPKLCEMASFDGDYIFICGHYEGFDERIRSLVDEEISIGDFVLTGGELAAMTVIDGITRLLPGGIGKKESYIDETHSEKGRIEYPHYTRPETWNRATVPGVLKSGNHRLIESWRAEASKNKSKKD